MTNIFLSRLLTQNLLQGPLHDRLNITKNHLQERDNLFLGGRPDQAAGWFGGFMYVSSSEACVQANQMRQGLRFSSDRFRS